MQTLSGGHNQTWIKDFSELSIKTQLITAETIRAEETIDFSLSLKKKMSLSIRNIGLYYVFTKSNNLLNELTLIRLKHNINESIKLLY